MIFLNFFLVNQLLLFSHATLEFYGASL